MKKMWLKQQDKVLALSDQLVVSGANFITGILIARFAGVDVYGVFAMYWMVFLFFRGFSTAFIGLPAQVLSHKAEDKMLYLEKNNQLGQWLLVLVLLIIYAGFILFDAITSAAFGYGFWLFPLAIVLYLKQEMNRKYFYALEANLKVLILDISLYLSQLIALFYLVVFSTFNLNSILVVMVISGGIGQVFFTLLKPNNRMVFRLSNLPWKMNWEYSRYLISTTVLQWFSGNFLLLLAASILGNSAVGIVRILQNIMGVLHLIFLTLENVVPVKAAFLLNRNGSGQMNTYLKKVTSVTGGAYIVLLLLLFLFGANLLRLLYGESAMVYAPFLNGFIVVYLLVFVGTMAQIKIKILGLNKSIFLAYCFSLLVVLVCAYPLLKIFGISGVIIGFGLMQLVTVSTYLFTLKRHII